MLRLHLQHLIDLSYFTNLEITSEEFNVAFSAAVSRSLEVEKARNYLEELKGLPLEGAWTSGINRASSYLTSDEALSIWSDELNTNLSEIAKAMKALKQDGSLALEHVGYFLLKEGLSVVARHVGIPHPYVVAAVTALHLAERGTKFVFQETGEFWEDAALASATAQVFYALHALDAAGTDGLDELGKVEALSYTSFVFYQHLHEAARNALLEPLGLNLSLIFNLGDSTPKEHKTSILKSWDLALSGLIESNWMPEEDFRDLGISRPRGIWSDGETLWVLGEDLFGLKEKLYAYNMKTKARDEEKDIDGLGLSAGESVGVWGDDSTFWGGLR